MIIRCFISLLLIFTSSFSRAVKIIKISTSGAIKNGTESHSIVDCEYEIDKRDVSTLEVKWYFRHDPTPIYTWVPPNHPQVAPLFKRHINLGYMATSDPLTKHRAIYIQNISTKLSGRYSCRVSSIYEDEFKSGQLTIYAEAKETSLKVNWEAMNLLRVVCTANQAYPEPEIRILVKSSGSPTREDFTSRASTITSWSDPTFNKTVSKTVMLDSLTQELIPSTTSRINPMDYEDAWQLKMQNARIMNTEGQAQGFSGLGNGQAAMVRCEFSLPNVPDYKLIKETSVPWDAQPMISSNSYLQLSLFAYLVNLCLTILNVP